MHSVRIAAAAAILAVGVNGMPAQAASSAGQPLPLLQILEQPFKAKAKPEHHVRSVRKTATKFAGRAKFASRTRKTHGFAARQDTVAAPDTPTAAVPGTAAASSWPQASMSAMAYAGAAAVPAVSGAATPDPSELSVRGQTVQVALPDTVNDLDRAADPPQAADAAGVKGDADARSAPQVMLAAPSDNAPSPVGSAAWIAKVLAALGGALVAGSAAWFMMGSTPQRTYG